MVNLKKNKFTILFMRFAARNTLERLVAMISIGLNISWKNEQNPPLNVVTIQGMGLMLDQAVASTYQPLSRSVKYISRRYNIFAKFSNLPAKWNKKPPCLLGVQEP